MRDQTIIEELNRMKQYIQMLENSVRLAFTGQEIRGAAIQSLLLKKNVLSNVQVDNSALVSKLVAFLSTKISMTEEEQTALTNDLKATVNLVNSPFLTQDELNAEIGATITNMQKQAEEAAKKQATEIIKPTTEQVQQVNNNPPPEPPKTRLMQEGGLIPRGEVKEVPVTPEVVPPQA